MGIQRTRMEFHNVVTYKTNAKMSDWMAMAGALKQFIIKNDLYMTGPFIVQCNPAIEGEMEIKVLAPIHQKITIDRSKDSKINFQEDLIIGDCLKIRHIDMDEDFQMDFEMASIVAKKLEIQLASDYYFVYLPVFHEYIVDIYMPIV